MLQKCGNANLMESYTFISTAPLSPMYHTLVKETLQQAGMTWQGVGGGILACITETWLEEDGGVS